MQHLIHIGEVFEHRREHDEAQHGLDPRHPASAAREFAQVSGEQRKHKKGRGKGHGKRQHPHDWLELISAYRCREQCAHKGADAGERSQAKSQPHQQRAEVAAAIRGRVQAREEAARQGEFEGP